MKKLLLIPLAIIFFANSSQAQTNLMNVKPWAYWLQNIDIQTIVNNNSFQLIVMDYSSDGIDSLKWSKEEINSIKNTGKYAIAYISIGEAEDYRFYWKSSWENNPPDWLGPENPDWEGNYKVKFWYPEWQSIIFQYLDKIMAQGFDGIYMDIIDGYYYWSEENGSQPLADSLMCQFIINIRSYVDNKTGNNDFILIPQNGEDIIYQENVSSELKNKYLNAINAIGVEDVFFPGGLDENNEHNPDNYRIDILKQYLDNSKQVYAVDYLTDPVKINQFVKDCINNNFVPYACTRDLESLCSGISTNVNDLESINYKFYTYPNPANNIINISFNQFEIDKINNIKLCNSLGQLINNYEKPNNDKSFVIDISKQKNGIYFLLFTYKNNLYSRKIIITHN